MAVLSVAPRLELPIHAVGLDIDGTCRDTGIRSFEAMCKTVEELGGTPPSFTHYVHGYEGDFHAYYRSCGVQETERVLPVYQRHVGNPDEVAPFPDLIRFLAHLRDLKVKVFAVSGHSAMLLQDWFGVHRISDHFLCLYGGTLNKRSSMLEACKEVGVDPVHACYVGDWGLDMRAAKAAGLFAIGITRGHKSKDTLVKNGAAFVIDHLSELQAQFH